MLKVLSENLSYHVHVRVRRNTVGPVRWDSLGVVEGVAAISVLLGPEERADGSLVWDVAVGSTGHQLVQERRGTEEQQGEWAEVEVRVVSERLLVSLVTVLGQVVTVVQTSRRVGHHLEEAAVEFVVVTLAEEIVISREGGVGLHVHVNVLGPPVSIGPRGTHLKLVVAIETWLAAGEGWVEGGSVGRVTSNGEALGDDITIGRGQAEKGEEDSEIVAHVVDVLLRVDQLVEGHDTITGKKTMVGRRVQPRAGATDITRARRSKFMGRVARSWHEIASFACSGLAILRTTVRELAGDADGWNMLGPGRVWASQRATGSRTTTLLTAKQARLDAGLLGDEGKCSDGLGRERHGSNRVLHDGNRRGWECLWSRYREEDVSGRGCLEAYIYTYTYIYVCICSSLQPTRCYCKYLT